MGYNINDVFPSKYLKAADLDGKTIKLTIKDVGTEMIGDDTKLIVYFKNQEKGLVMNKTNSNNIAMVFGPDTDGWLDQDIQVYPTMVDFQGRSMEAIRVKAVPRPAGRRQGATSFPQKGFSDTGPTRREGPSLKEQLDRLPKRDPDDPRTMMGAHDPNLVDDPNDELPPF
jgi:hypothetical protein